MADLLNQATLETTGVAPSAPPAGEVTLPYDTPAPAPLPTTNIPPSPWQKEASSYRQAGFSETEIYDEAERARGEMNQAGFDQKEIDNYFGVKNPDMKVLRNSFETNLRILQEEKRTKEGTGTPTGIIPSATHPADGFIEAFEAGWQMSVTGLIKRGGLPDIANAPDAGMAMRIAEMLGETAGDIPWMIAGGVGGGIGGGAAGGTAGSAIPAIGNAAGAAGGAYLGASAGGFALPTLMRKVLMDHYEKGDVRDFDDFWERASATFIETAKSAGLGIITGGMGLAGKGLGKFAGPGISALAGTAAEITTMVTVGKALQGEAPKPEDFLEAAILVGGLHASFGVASKLRGIYAERGVKPSEIALEAQRNPELKEQLLADSPAVRWEGMEISKPGFAGKLADERGSIDLSPKPKKPEIVRTDAEKEVLSKIGETDKPTVGEKVVSAVTGGYQYVKEGAAYKDWIDKLDPWWTAVEKIGVDVDKLPANESPPILARTANDYKAKATAFIEDATADFNGKRNGKGLEKILEPVLDDYQGFKAYLAAKRAVEVESQGKNSGINLDAAKQVAKDGEAKFGQAQKETVEFSNRILDYLYQSERISKDVRDVIKEKNKDYVPFGRLLEPEEIEAGKRQSKPNNLKAFKGSDRSIQDPILTILENLQTSLKLAEKNRAVRSLIDLADKQEGQTLFKKVKADTNTIEISAKELSRHLEDYGVDEAIPSMEIFRKNLKTELKPNEFEVFRKGKREVYETDPILAESIKALDGDTTSQHIIIRFAKTVTGLKKLGITFVPDFQVKNVIRDQVTSGVYTKGGSIPFADALVAMKSLITKDESYYDFLRSGGANGSFMELDEAYLKKNILKLNDETGFLDTARNIVKTPFHWLKLAGELGEMSTRLAEFKRVSGGAQEGAKLFEGGFAAREVTLDFSRMGAKVSSWNAITAFMNVSVQGLDKTARAFKEDPAKLSMRAMTYITVPSVLLWWAQKDDPRYQQIARWQKDLFWPIITDRWQKVVNPEVELAGVPDYLIRKSGDGYEINRGTIYRIPKPQELGILFGSLPERLLEKFFTDNPRAMKQFDETMQNLITPSFIPDAAVPVLEHLSNRVFFTGNPIVNSSVEKLLPQEQYSDYTTESAKALGKLVGKLPILGDAGPKNLPLQSPAILENYVRELTGPMGMYTLQAADKILMATGVVNKPPRAEWTLADVPAVKAFVIRYPSMGAQSISDFRERYQENRKPYDTWKQMGKQGRFEEMASIMDQYQESFVQLTGINDSISKMTNLVRKINDVPDYTPKDKRQIIDGLYYSMIELSRQGNLILDEVEKGMKNGGKK